MISLGALAALRGWRLYAAIGAGVVLLVLVWKVYGWKRDAERLADARAAAEQVEMQRKASEAQMQHELTAEKEIRLEAEQREAQARAQAREFASLAQHLGQQAAQLATRQQQVQTEINALSTPAEFELRIKQDLALRRPEDMARPGFVVDELKLIAQAVADRPIILERLEKVEGRTVALAGQVDAQKGELKAVQEQLASEKRARASLERGYGELTGYYVTLYNSIGVKKRSGKCLYLWKCGEKKLPTPAPAELAEGP